MKKVIFLVFLALVISVLFFSTVYAQEPLSVYIDGKEVEFDVQPQVIDGRTMVPIRAIFEKMGASVVWDENA